MPCALCQCWNIASILSVSSLDTSTRSQEYGSLHDVGKPKVSPKMTGGLYHLRKESNEKEMQKWLCMLLLQAELEHNNHVGGWGKERQEGYMAVCVWERSWKQFGKHCLWLSAHNWPWWSERSFEILPPQGYLFAHVNLAFCSWEGEPFSETVCINMPYFAKSWQKAVKADCYCGYLTGSNLLASFIWLHLICVPLLSLCSLSALSRICP